MSYQHIVVDDPRPRVRRITLNRPEKRNALNNRLRAEVFEVLEAADRDPEISITILRGAGPCFSAGYDLSSDNSVDQPWHSAGGPGQWSRHVVEGWFSIWDLAKPVIAQVHGYCLGGALGIMNCHDLVYAADDAQLGMPEILRGSFGQLVTSTLLHGGLPVKKLAHIALTGRNVTGKEADALGIISQAVPAAALEEYTVGIAREIASRHLAPLEHHKITVQMGRDLSMSQAIQLDQLVGQRLRRAMDPLGDVESYLKSQKGGPNPVYKRSDV